MDAIDLMFAALERRRTPRDKQRCSEALGAQKKAEFDKLEAGRPREAVLAETKYAAPL